ncbi:immediate early response gene 2 protein-like [Megalops cyprinoides]|uniref:immediate early response gene 2 protein-like n=1 Tax=Megalops cyprinoides TaxID=118141 RepID=UPI0018642C22|nr:immediate early response gene 2 protein-like [Megalops cyprinoides]
MDVSAEAKRIMVQALGKLYSSRTQRGGLRLHRSLLLTLVMRSARDIYHTAHMTCENEGTAATPSAVPEQAPAEEAMDTSGVPAETSGSDCAPPASTEKSQQSEGEEKPSVCKRTQANKENCNPLGHDRHSRKRRGKAAAEPDFLPSKRAKMEAGEERVIVQSAALRSNSGSCSRVGNTLTSLPVSQAIAAF